jgi:hypothetical protein
MKNESNIDFRIRGYYPNYHSIQLFLSDERKNKSREKDIGFLHAEVEYWKTGEQERVLFHPGISDVPLLCQPDKEDSLRYLGLLLQAEKGNKAARAAARTIREEYREKMKAAFSPTGFIENEYVIPSVSRNCYDDTLISQKGNVLLELYQEGFPVPDFCILTSRSYQLDAREREYYMRSAISNMEKMNGQVFGNPDDPLIVAMRCATPHYIPGLMPTYLNVGVTKLTYRSLIRKYGNEVANKIYLNNLKTILQILSSAPDIYKIAMADCNQEKKAEQKISGLLKIISRLDERILLDAYYQATVFMNAAHDFFIRNQDLIYTFQSGKHDFPSLILQKMVWTVRNKDSYPGVLYSRHPRTGLGLQIESVREIFGEEIMTGIIHAEQKEYFEREEIKEEFPAIYHFTPMLPILEVKLKSPVTLEFAVESFHNASFFAILQMNMSELTGRSTLLTAIDLYQKKIISKKRVIQLIRPYHLRQIFSERIDDESLRELTLFGYGISVLPRSAVSAIIYFSMSKALEAKKRGEKVCLCKENFIPTETILMAELDAILSMNPLAIHVVTACLGYGIPAFIDLKNYQIRLQENSITNNCGLTIHEGDWITVSSKRHCIFKGKAYYKPARFQKYLEGQKLEMDLKEERVFINMAKAYREYQEILDTLKTEESMSLPDLVKLIRNDYDQQPEKARDYVNGWFDLHANYYFSEILKSGLGSHMDQHKIYSLLTTGRKIIFFKNIIRICAKSKIKGFNAGAFMLGRFLCQSHPVSFWKAFNPAEIVFLLNEYILFEKYMKILSEFGERNLSRTRNRILTEELNNISLQTLSPETFMTLKFCVRDWREIERHLLPEHDKETHALVKLLQNPFGFFFEYDVPWSFDRLRSLCEQENMAIPGRDAV